MLIPIIKESERLFEKSTIGIEYIPNAKNILKQLNVSSQLALLEGLKKQITEITKKCEGCGGVGYTAEHDTASRHGEDGEFVNCPIQVQCFGCYIPLQVIQSLEESITYLKSKI